VKLYDKAFTAVGSCCGRRPASTTADSRVYRRKEGDTKGEIVACIAWWVADLHRPRNFERATERYLNALAGVDEQTSLQELARPARPLTLHSSRTAAGGA